MNFVYGNIMKVIQGNGNLIAKINVSGVIYELL